MTDPFKAAIAILGLVLVLLFGAWLVLGRTAPSSGAAQQTTPQAATTPSAEYHPAIPPIDATVPAKTETATFALG